MMCKEKKSENVTVNGIAKERENMIAYAITFVILLSLSLIAFKDKDKKLKKQAVVFLAAVLLVEVFGFNFNGVRSLFQKEETFSVGLSDGNVTVRGNDGTIENGIAVTKKEGGVTSVVLQNVDRKIVSVTPELQPHDSRKTGNVTVRLYAADESYSESFRPITAEKTLSPTAESTVLPVELTGNCTKFKITFSSQNSTAAEITGLKFNEKVPINLSCLRLLAAVCLAAGFYVLVVSDFSKKKIDDEKKKLRKCIKIAVAISVVACIVLSYTALFDDNGGVPYGFSKTYGDQMTKELVDAFESGHLYLTDTPSDELLSLENPYDWSQRSNAEVNAKWDHLLYEGKYYSYYGIAPVLLLFLPFHALTGLYFSSALAILLFSAVGVAFLILLFKEYAERFFKNITVGMFLSALLITIFSSGIWYSLCFANFYETAQSAGFMFTCGGFYFLLRSNVVGGGKIRKPSLALSSAFLSLAVLSRPTLALYCVTALVFIWFGLKKNMADNDEKLVSKGSVKYLLCALVPYAVFGGIQCLYNFARFGSPLDFGIQYSLTINDFTRSQFYADFFNISFHNFILAFPIVKSVFPFVFSNFSSLGANGYYFAANENAVGIFWRALTSLGLFAIVPAARKLDRSERTKIAALMMPVCVLAPLIIIFSIWESGYGVRYCADFSWQIVLGGTTVLFIVYERICGKQMKRLFEILFPAAALLSFTVNFALVYEYCNFTGFLRDAALVLEQSLSLLS